MLVASVMVSAYPIRLLTESHMAADQSAERGMMVTPPMVRLMVRNAHECV